MPEEQPVTNPPETPKPAAAAKPAPKPPAKPQVKWSDLAKKLKSKFKISPNLMVGKDIESVLLEDSSQLIELMKSLQSEHNYKVLLTINAIEYKECFQVVYQLQSVEPYGMFCVRINLDKANPKIQTLTSLFGSADWYEREIWDMQGIVFEGHPNLIRLLNPEAWEGFPMRKDYIPPMDALNGPITAVKSNMNNLERSVRNDVEIIQEPAIQA
ncbi:MAG: NADH-quinone oxidoreductase subunit C [Candidatus Caenarcaniphilales bacterium]|nr:NADH-quinone oxidoreductase subunit C [Candidatus Caenarcaniphilales bacterium]